MSGVSIHYRWIAFSTLVRREVRRFMRLWVQTLVPPVITISLYFVIFGNLIGRRIGEMSGYSYMDFIVPGLILMAVINNAYLNVVSSFFSQKFQRNIEELLVSPVPNYVILIGFVVGGSTRGIIVGFIATLIAMFFSGFYMHNIFIALTVVLLSSVLFSTCGLINAIYAKNFDDITVIPTFVLTPLIYLGGVFYSTDLLPDFWRTASYFNPIFYMVDAFRFGILGISDVNIIYALLILYVFVIGFFSFALFLLHRGIGLRD